MNKLLSQALGGAKSLIMIKGILKYGLILLCIALPDEKLYCQVALESPHQSNHVIEDLEDIRVKRQFGVSLFTVGILTGVSADYFLTPHINISAHTLPLVIFPDIWGGGAEVGLILNLGYGAKFHFKKKNSKMKWSPFIGFELTHFLNDNLRFFYIPVGFQKMMQGGAQFSLEIAAISFDEGPNSRDPYLPWIGIRIGRRF